MRFAAVIALLVLPFLAVAQSTQNNTSPAASGTATVAPSGSSTQAPSVILSTSFTTGVGLGPGRVATTFTSSVVFTITPTPTQSSAGNNTSSGNNTTSSSSSPSSTGPLPTAPTDINGGGDGPGGNAPAPGQSAPNGIYGPPDGYISAVLALPINAFLACIAAVALGGTLVLG
ncbi:hypothetical protein PsYK624_021700 [Phanerochaete sordida]|uniref:Uncharacterized protein n=1 Tax=Phanerochaete sordida TaxID=48140 RepID=A0A9P3G1B6_9APHY|nr:hypothetical protein PsYK624_021700 [Phanerochaete sordida]